MTKNDIIKLFGNIKVWKRGSQRAPHKALLVLYALGKCQQGAERLIPYSEIDDALRSLLIDFGPPRKSYHPEYPFWRLQNDKVWEIPNKDGLTRRKSNTDAKKSELIKYDIHGGFTKPIYQYLMRNKSGSWQIAETILAKSFPESFHEDIINTVGLSISTSSKRPKRNSDFRDRVIRAYEFKCAVCGYDVKLGMHNLGLEAAHIKWHMAGGPDVEENGMAFCVLHHKMFDRGAFTITENYSVLISQHVHGSTGLEESLLRYNGQQINMAQSEIYFPNKKFLKWHCEQVFREPAKDIAFR